MLAWIASRAAWGAGRGASSAALGAGSGSGTATRANASCSSRYLMLPTLSVNPASARSAVAAASAPSPTRSALRASNALTMPHESRSTRAIPANSDATVDCGRRTSAAARRPSSSACALSSACASFLAWRSWSGSFSRGCAPSMSALSAGLRIHRGPRIGIAASWGLRGTAPTSPVVRERSVGPLCRVSTCTVGRASATGGKGSRSWGKGLALMSRTDKWSRNSGRTLGWRDPEKDCRERNREAFMRHGHGACDVKCSRRGRAPVTRGTSR